MHARNLVLLVAVCLLATGCTSPLLRVSAPVLLDGSWEYYPGQFLSGRDFDTPEAKTLLRRVRSWYPAVFH